MKTEEQYQLEQEERRQFEKQQEEDYNRKLYEWECYCESVKPIPPPLYFTHYKPTPDFPEVAETASEAQRIYQKALSQWQMMCSMDAPNKPGYYRANND